MSSDVFDNFQNEKKRKFSFLSRENVPYTHTHTHTNKQTLKWKKNNFSLFLQRLTSSSSSSMVVRFGDGVVVVVVVGGGYINDFQMKNNWFFFWSTAVIDHNHHNNNNKWMNEWIVRTANWNWMNRMNKTINRLHCP